MIILAFPGMGKTPLVKRNGKYVDLDFGFFRSALDVKKENERSILPQFARLAKMYEKEGYIVLTNEPKLAEFLHVDRMFLPERRKFSARKMNVSENQIAEWISGWQEIAQKFNIPVTFISVGLDHYLK